MRGLPIALLLTAAVALAEGPSAQASGPVKLLPVVAEEAKFPSTLASRKPIPDQVLRAKAERERRWREYPHHFSPPGMDWSLAAARRPEAAAQLRARLGRKGAGPLPEVESGDLLGFPADTIRVAFIRVDFRNDRNGSESTGNGRFDLSGPDTLSPPIDRPPHNRDFYRAHLEALKRYFEVQAYDRTILAGDVWPRDQNRAYSLSDMADFGPWEFSQDIFRVAVHLFRSMMFAADSQSVVLGDRIPWDSYDRIILIHAGSDLQSDVRRDSPLDIPSFTIGVADTDVVIFPDSLGRPIDRAAIFPETVNQDGFFGTINGVVAHECGHLLFGLADLYDINTGQPHVGYWSLMDSGNLVGSIVLLADGSELFATGLLPPSVDPWQRQFLGDALFFPEAAYGDTMDLQNSERHPDVRRVWLSSDEYLLLENRYLAPAAAVEIEQDSVTRVILGPKNPDRFEYDALLPGTGVLVWHIDESVIPNEFVFPCDTARANPDCGINTNFFRPGVSLIEADGLQDLGDPGSPFFFGAPFDPYFKSNNASLGDTTLPRIVPHIGTVPHVRLDFLDDPQPSMRVAAFRTWQLPGWPVVSDFPPAGPMLLAVDADGDRTADVCWAGGGEQALLGGLVVPNPDSAALFAVRVDGNGLAGPSHVFARLPQRPRPIMAAVALGEVVVPGEPPQGPSLFAVSTYASGPDTASAGGRVWLIDHLGVARAGWPPALPSIVTTPPVFAGAGLTATVYVGCADGRVYALDVDGAVLGASDPPLAGGVSGRLAVHNLPAGGRGEIAIDDRLIAAGGASGEIAVLLGSTMRAATGWPQRVTGSGIPGPPLDASGFTPDFLWLDFGGASGGTDCFGGALSLIAHHQDWLWGFCSDGLSLPGWGRDVGDTLVAGLGAGDPDGDGVPEVLTHSVTSRIAFWNSSGRPSPGWPKAGSREGFRSGSPPLALDLDADGRSEVVALNASGVIAALDARGKVPPGWPLAAGLGAVGASLAVDLDRDGFLELVAPDRFGVLYAYSLPARLVDPIATSWTMLGGDAGRTSSLTFDRTPTAAAAGAGPLIQGSLKVYPNPARRTPVTFAYTLTEAADVEFRIVDTSGHEVASFSRAARQTDNAEVWDPAGLPAGLYMARLRFRGARSERVEIIPVGIIR